MEYETKEVLLKLAFMWLKESFFPKGYFELSNLYHIMKQWLKVSPRKIWEA